MTPYLEYPQLLSVLLRMLNEGEGSVHIRREVLKVRHPVVANVIRKFFVRPTRLQDSRVWPKMGCMALAGLSEAGSVTVMINKWHLCKPNCHCGKQVLGIIGALDPHTHKTNQADLQGEGKLEREGVRPQRQPNSTDGQPGNSIGESLSMCLGCLRCMPEAGPESVERSCL